MGAGHNILFSLLFIFIYIFLDLVFKINVLNQLNNMQKFIMLLFMFIIIVYILDFINLEGDPYEE